MGRTRRQPPLYEVLSSPSRRLGGAAAPPRQTSPVPELKPAHAAPPPPPPQAEPALEPAPHPEPAPTVRIHAPSQTAESVEPAAPVRADEDVQVRISSTMLMIALGVLIIIFATVWAIAFQAGQKKRDNEIAQWQQPDGDPAGAAGAEDSPKPPAPVPAKPEGSGNTPKKPDPAKPAPPAAADSAADPRVPGFNYLYLGTLTQKDAAAGVDFLKRNGVQAFYTVDRQKPGGNNPPCRIYASQGFPGGPRFKETEKERSDLVRRIEELGKKWQREEKGASDFRQPYWTLHKG